MKYLFAVVLCACAVSPEVTSPAPIDVDEAEIKGLPLPRTVTLTYTQDDGMFAEGAELRSAADESHLTGYALYWASAFGVRLGKPIAVLPLGDHQTVRIGENVPALARYLVACSRSKDGQSCGTRYRLRPVDVAGVASALVHMAGALDDLHDCPGMDLAKSCGDLACEGKETAENCPSDCSRYQLASYNYQTLCNEVGAVHAPKSIEELQYIVANATELKVKAAGHSATDILCTRGDLVDVSAFNHVVGLEGDTVVVETGVKMFELGDWLHTRGLSIGYAHLGFNATTVGGTIATSAHGSTAEHGSILSQRLEALDVVLASGELRRFSRADGDAWRALTTNLGLLGVVVRAHIRVEPQFNLHAKVTIHESASLFEGDFIDNVKGCDFGQINWFPSAGRYLRTCATKTDATAEPGAENTLLWPEIPSQLKGPTKRLLQAGACDRDNGFDDFLEELRLATLWLSPPFVKMRDGKRVHTTDAIGPSHKIMSSALTPEQAGFFQMDWEVVVPESRMNEAMAFIRDFVEQERLRLPLVGMFLRFSKIEADSLLAYEGAGGAYEEGRYGLHIEMPIYVPVGFSPERAAEHMAPFRSYVTTLVEDFDGRGHWGKNRDWLFPLEVRSGTFGDKLDRFAAVKRTLDPTGKFHNRFADNLGFAK